MNQQDTAAADAILLLEAEKKVKIRIAQVIHDVVEGNTDNTLVGWDYDSLISHLHMLMLHKTQQNIKHQINKGLS